MEVLNYPSKKGIIKEYYDIRNFLIKIKDAEYSYARWDWMITHSMTKAENLSKIGIWKENKQIVGLVIFDIIPDTLFIRTLSTHKYLLKDMFEYAKSNFVNKNLLQIMIQDDDDVLQKIVAKEGMIATNQKEYTSIFFPEESTTDYNLPKGFNMVSLKEAPDIYQYYRLFWRGFNHELNGEGPYKHSPEKEKEGKREIFRDNNNLEHKMIVQNKEGVHVAFCGLWYDSQLDFAIVEPLTTDPDYRRLGLAQATMFEGIKRVYKAGAKRIVVNTSKQFYYNRGFRPYKTQTVWEMKIL
ncbi:MAG: GNAT family N-acetyltransferase [Bacillota bacterium]